MDHVVHISDGPVTMEGNLSLPEQAKHIVLFAHGSGSSRFSPRNMYVAKVLQQAGFATLLIDLLSEEEDSIYETRFDIALLTERLIAIVHWLENVPATKHLSISLFGASTGAASAIRVAAKLGASIKAVVSRGGRPDLSMKELPLIVSPTLFIVGSKDPEVLQLNQRAFQELRCTKKLEIVQGATHLFEEPGCLEEVARLSKEWLESIRSL